MNSSIKASLTAGAVLVLGSLGVVGLFGSGERRPAEGASDEAFWNKLRVSGDEVERYDALSKMAKAADLVVIGRASNFRVSRKLQGDAPEDVVVYGAMDVTIEKTLRGTAPGASVPVELLLPHRPDRIDAIVSAQRASIPQGQLLLMLRHKGGAERGLYRLVESRGLWVSELGTLRAPLAKDPVPERAPALTVAAALQQADKDRSVVQAASLAGKLEQPEAHPGFKLAVRPSSTARATDQVAARADSDEPEVTYRAELAGKTTIAELASLVSR